jgi:TolA-binding protein
MSYPRKALVPMLLVLFCLAPLAVGAQSSSPAADLKDGIDQFRTGQYDKAILLLHNIILDPGAVDQKPMAYLLIAKAYLAIGKLDEAEHNLEFYIATYPAAPDIEEALYQKGRLLFLQNDFENAIRGLQSFISSYPKSSFLPSAWFWVGESLFGLGRLDDALAVYKKIVADFPTSVKIEASQYKISLIQLQKKEVELSKLLKWSHEDFLRSVEEYQNREKAYEQAIEAYQKRLASTSPSDDQQTIASLQAQLAQKTAEAAQLSAKLAQAGGSTSAGTTAAAASATSAAVSAQAARLAALLAAKADALALKAKYLAWLEANGGAAK